MNIKTLLATTAIVAATSTGAYIATPSTYAAAATAENGYVQTVDAKDHYASELIGSTVYTSAAEDAEAIGDVNDLVLSPNGDVDAVIIGVGGFLGLGEKNVAVSFDRLEWQRGNDGEVWPVMAATKEELESAPAFERDQAAMAAADPNNPDAADTAMRDGDMMAETPADEMAETPAADKDMAKNDEAAMKDQAAMQEETPDQTAMTNDPSQPAADQQRQGVDPATISAENLIDTTVYSSDGENVGEVSDVLLSDGGEIEAIVIDVGGFLGIGEKPVAISYSDLEMKVDENEDLMLQTAFTRDQLDAAPEYDETAFKQNPESVMVRSKS